MCETAFRALKIDMVMLICARLNDLIGMGLVLTPAFVYWIFGVLRFISLHFIFHLPDYHHIKTI